MVRDRRGAGVNGAVAGGVRLGEEFAGVSGFGVAEAANKMLQWMPDLHSVAPVHS
jgi:hypothetical protein